MLKIISLVLLAVVHAEMFLGKSRHPKSRIYMLFLVSYNASEMHLACLLPCQKSGDHTTSPFQNWPQQQRSAPLGQRSIQASPEDALNPRKWKIVKYKFKLVYMPILLPFLTAPSACTDSPGQSAGRTSGFSVVSLQSYYEFFKSQHLMSYTGTTLNSVRGISTQEFGEVAKMPFIQKGYEELNTWPQLTPSCMWWLWDIGWSSSQKD